MEVGCIDNNIFIISINVKADLVKLKHGIFVFILIIKPNNYNFINCLNTLNV